MKSYQCSIHWVHHAIESPYNQQLSFANEPKTHAHTHTHIHTQLCVFCFLFWESTSNKPNRQAVGTHTSQAQCGRRLWQGFQPAHQQVWSPDTCSEVPQGPRQGLYHWPIISPGVLGTTVFEKHVPNWTHFLSSDWIIIIIIIHSFTHSHDAAVTANVLGAATKLGWSSHTIPL